MAKTTQPAAARLVEARALVALTEMGVQAGGLLRAEAAVVAGLVATGRADDHPDAVAYAKANQQPSA